LRLRVRSVGVRALLVILVIIPIILLFAYLVAARTLKFVSSCASFVACSLPHVRTR
jgi:hypothetical protein